MTARDWWSLGFIVVGGALQIVGVLILLQGVTAVRRYRSRPIRGEAHMEMPGFTQSGTGTVTPTEPPTLEQRVASLEQVTLQQSEQLQALPRELKTQWRTYTDEHVELLGRALSKEIEDLAAAATGNRRWYVWAYASIGLIASGVLLATIGGIIGLS